MIRPIVSAVLQIVGLGYIALGICRAESVAGLAVTLILGLILAAAGADLRSFRVRRPRTTR